MGGLCLPDKLYYFLERDREPSLCASLGEFFLASHVRRVGTASTGGVFGDLYNLTCYWPALCSLHLRVLGSECGEKTGTT